MTPTDKLVLSAIRELSLKAGPVTYAGVERRLNRSQSTVYVAVNSLIRYGHVGRKRTQFRGVWMTALLPKERLAPTDGPQITPCPAGYAAGYGWEIYPESPKWES